MATSDEYDSEIEMEERNSYYDNQPEEDLYYAMKRGQSYYYDGHNSEDETEYNEETKTIITVTPEGQELRQRAKAKAEMIRCLVKKTSIPVEIKRMITEWL